MNARLFAGKFIYVGDRTLLKTIMKPSRYHLKYDRCQRRMKITLTVIILLAEMNLKNFLRSK